jgi:hypothetical protein
MADEDVLIFLSYAHDDDLTTSASQDEAGFVSFLYQMLQVKLRDLGATRAKIWIDRRRVSGGDQFDDVIDDGLNRAGLLIVVMSNNWMQRPYCRKELEAFADLCKKRGVSNVHERMIVVGKGHVDRLKRPFELQGQEGFLLYARDETNGVADVAPFFNRGKANDKYYDVRDQLATFLQRRVDHIAEGARSETTPSQDRPIAALNGRTVYLAKPASDMKEAYARLAFELQGKGFSVVPDATIDLPSDSSALKMVNDALAKAEASVHLLGERPGFAPEGLDPIVKLQLALAREKAVQSADQSQRGFRRIVWAPKLVDAGGASGDAVKGREPLDALAGFDQQFPTDKISGDILGKFIEFLFQYLTETAPRLVVQLPVGGKIQVFLDYNQRDEDYALQIATALDTGEVTIHIPAAGEPDPDARRFNSELLARCDAFALCWANAPEVWVRSEADRLNDWQALGRKHQFAFRSLIAGPPANPRKRANMLKFLFRSGEFDNYVDLIEKGPPTIELLIGGAADAKPPPP